MKNLKRRLPEHPALLALAIILIIWGWGAFGLAQTSGPAPAERAPIENSQASEGAKKFEENCSRCHNAPEGFSPRISGTIVRHMRVRASLSKKDAEAILKFLNP
jgi:mono/diheme cytochrome c family protein